MSTSTTEQEIRDLEAKLEAARARRSQEVAGQARQQVQDLATFKAMTDEQRSQIRHADKPTWDHYMDLLRQEGEQRLLDNESRGPA